MDDSRAAVGTETDESAGRAGAVADDGVEQFLSDTKGYLDKGHEGRKEQAVDEHSDLPRFNFRSLTQ